MNTIEEPTRAPIKPARRAKRKKRSVQAKTVKAAVAATADDLGGLTATECPYDCSPERCVISGMAICGHPKKGSLQPAVQRIPEAMVRYNAARKILAHQVVDKRP